MISVFNYLIHNEINSFLILVSIKDKCVKLRCNSFKHGWDFYNEIIFSAATFSYEIN